jgi:hypothetical protein
MKQNVRKFHLWSLLPIALLLVSCGTGTTAGTASSGTTAIMTSSSSSSGGHVMAAAPPSTKQSPAINNQAAQQGVQNNSSSALDSTPYLVKTLDVTMEVKDTRQTADALQTWITTTDPHAFSEGMNYQQIAANTYDITMSFSVQASLYPQIARYLRDYAPQQKGQLTQFQESVQDVTNDYIDTQSRLKNLRGEQARLLGLMNQAQTLNDVLNVEQRLTDVEGQIEQIEEHINDLGNQLQFYTITITLQPLTIPVPPPVTPGWNIGQIFHDAFAASLAFAQELLTMLIWLLAFSVYIVPLLVVAWFVHRWRAHKSLIPRPAPKA